MVFTGYWSTGTRLADSARVSGDGIESGDFPEYMCGGAQTRTRSTAQRRRRRALQPSDTGPSLHTGRQTAKRRKAGGRVTSKFAFVGSGSSLTDDAQSSKGKRARSNRAREERALAAEMRLRAFNPARGTSSSDQRLRDGDSESDSEIEFVQETDAERRQTLEDSKGINPGEDDRHLGKGLLWKDFEDEFNFSAPRPEGSRPRPESPDVIELTDESDTNGEQCDTLVRSGSTFTSSRSREGFPPIRSTASISTRGTSGKGKQTGNLGLRNIAQSEVELRKKEALGLAPVNKYRKLGEAPKANPSSHEPVKSTDGFSSRLTSKWNCLVCTLQNQPEHLACAACATPKGESTYHIR